tara:strand:+ start:55 stop:765 length:711 start_codon:yes stop_codon:yes gene_type:complete
MKIFGIIPARLNSTRLPKKALIKIKDKTLIQRVYENIKYSDKIKHLVIATNDKEIEKNVKSFGGDVVYTKENHTNGTERCREAVKKLKIQDDDIVLNIQCDEPMMDKEAIDLIYSAFKDNPKLNIVTLASSKITEDELHNQSVVKVVLDENFFATKFCRKIKNTNALKHIGIYAYKKKVLVELAKLKPTRLEKIEKLEQLRWTGNNYQIKCVVTKKNYISINTKEDLNTYKKNYIL